MNWKILYYYAESVIKNNMECKGIVEAIKQREKGYSIKIGDMWASGFGKSPVDKGQEIEFEFEKSADGKFNNIKFIKDISKPKPINTAGEVIGESAKTKRRAECMTCAKDICIARGTIKDEEILNQYKWFCKMIGEDANI